eukprot:6192840-Pleurochrysis_carterae.AAC.1
MGTPCPARPTLRRADDGGARCVRAANGSLPSRACTFGVGSHESYDIVEVHKDMRTSLARKLTGPSEGANWQACIP